MKEGLAFHNWKEAFSSDFRRTEKIKGITRRQRKWILRAWQAVYGVKDKLCGFPIEHNDKLYIHGRVHRVEIHHIVPRGYASFVLGWSENQINSPLNLIPLCETHHRARGLQELDYFNNLVPAVHPDMEVARRGYTGKEHPNSFDYAFENRQELMKKYEQYHNPDWDRMLLQKAQEVFDRYMALQLELKGKYYDPFPYR